MSRPSDRNLLFGILALQMDFVAKSDLLEGMQAWLLNKDKTLGELLCERGVLSPENRSLLDPLVDANIRQHGGEAQHSLAALSSDGGLAVELAHADDDELRHSLSLLPRHEPLLPREVGFPSSAALQEDHDGSDQGEAVAAGELPADQSPGELPAARFQETLIPGTLDQMDEPKLRFRILRPHAEGGLGRVHVALDQELNREVAFKEIKFEYARRKDAQSRFVVEAEVTGGLEHPGIVPVYGLGHFDDGRPFYAMRFIRGQSLLDAVRGFYGQARRDKSQPADAPASASAASPTDKLPYASQREFRDLINRLIDVCNAMQYAHDRKVLHRDLKPGNIMLGKYGETLVVDWGLAKAVGKDNPLERSSDGELPIVPASGSQSAPTQMGSTLGTPAYMSPEQAEGKLDLLGPSCDIYSLGATLYEILTGQAPLKGLRIPDLLKRVSSGDIPLPRTINPHAPRALQAVCQKAMARRPQDRYATAKQLANDLEAWLADEPVSAFREPLLARSRRWMRRHPAVVSATAASILLTVVGLGGFSSVLASKNEQLAESNTQLSNSLDREETARRLAEDNERRALAGEALARTNQQRAIAGENLAKSNAAEAARNALEATRQRDAAEAAQQLAEQNAESARKQSQLALDTLNQVIFDVQRSLTNLPGGGTVRRAILSSVLEQLEQVSTQYVAQSAVDRNTMAALMELGDVILSVGNVGHVSSEPGNADDPAETVPRATSALATVRRLYERARAIAQQLAAARPTDTQAQRDLSVSLSNLGDLALTQGDLGEARRLFGESFDISQRLAESDTDNAAWQRGLSVSLEKLGDLALTQGDLGEARRLFGELLDIAQRLAESDPDNAAWQRDLSVSLEKLGDLALTQGDLGEARRLFGESLDIRQRLAESDPDNAAWQRDLMVSHYKLGGLHQTAQEFDRAIEQYRLGVAVLERLIEQKKLVEASRRELAILRRKVQQCELTLMAIGDWENVLAQPAADLPLLLTTRCTELAKQKRSADVAQAAAKLQELAASAEKGNDNEQQRRMLYNAACGYGQCAKLSAGWDGKSPASGDQNPEAVELSAEQQAERERFTTLALTALKAALDAGFDNFEHLQQDADLAALREHPDFKTLLPGDDSAKR